MYLYEPLVRMYGRKRLVRHLVAEPPNRCVCVCVCVHTVIEQQHTAETPPAGV
jgi:hypothetical protein